MDRYVELLKKKGLKITPQRLEILRYLDENRIHPNIERIYSDLKKDNPSLSKTTVYNVIDDLTRADLLQVLTINRFEILCDFKADPHHHFLCKECKKVYDLDEDFNCHLLEKVRSEGYQVDEVHGYFKGTCRSCLKKKEGGR